MQFMFDGESLITPELIAEESVSSRARGHDEQIAIGKARLALALQMARQRLASGSEPAAAVQGLAADLHRTRTSFDPSVWYDLVPVVQNHPIAALLLQDPFTRWSFEKPRGYSGDAHLLDFIYGHPSIAEDIGKATALGRALYGITSESASSSAVRERRDLLTRHVDAIAAARGPDTEILTIAAGHLREANRSVALRERRIQRWIALDQDPLSVGSITRDFHGTCVEAIDGSVRGLLTNAYPIGRFDFIYAAGLYDYLARNVAIRLTQTCLRMLKPDGVLLFANFAPDMTDDGYMETFMNWALLLRSETDIWDIINASVDRNAVDAAVHFGANRNIVYGTLSKRSSEERRSGAVAAAGAAPQA